MPRLTIPMTAPRPRPLSRIGAGLLGVTAVCAGWQWLSESGWLPKESLPSFLDAFRAAVGELSSAASYSSIAETLAHSFLGLLLAMVIATPLGLLIGLSSRLDRYTRSTIDFLRSVPSIILLPLFILIAGTGLKVTVFMVTYSVGWTMLVYAASGAASADPLMHDTARALRLSRPRTFWSVLVPSAATFIATSVRVTIPIAFAVSVGCEMIAGTPGLGSALVQSLIAGAATRTYGLIIVCGFIGLILNGGAMYVERRLLSWHPQYRAGGAA